MKLPGDSETSPRIEKVPTETLGHTKLYTEGFKHMVQIGSKISRSYKFSFSAKQTPSTPDTTLIEVNIKAISQRILQVCQHPTPSLHVRYTARPELEDKPI